MKNMLPTLVLLLLSFTTFSIDAENSYTITSNGSGVFTVNYHSNQVSKVKVAIYDAKKNLVFSEVIANVNTFTRPYNFNGLPTGEYTLLIENSAGKYEEKIIYKVNKEKGILRFFKGY